MEITWSSDVGVNGNAMDFRKDGMSNEVCQTIYGKQNESENQKKLAMAGAFNKTHKLCITMVLDNS